MKIRRFDDSLALGRAAAAQAATAIRRAIAEKGTARILTATDGEHVEFLDALTREQNVAWGEVELFHLGEYIGLGMDHPASLRRGLVDRLISGTRAGRYHLLHGDHDAERICREEGEHLRAAPIDVAFVGIGANGGLAFNDPPADFATEKPYLILRLDEPFRQRQVDVERFATVAEVPERAISISIRQLLKAKTIIAVVPGALKAEAVKRCVEGSVSPFTPASILSTHPDTTIYVDQGSASLLNTKPALDGA